MDLRIQKTLDNIEREFLLLRAGTPLNKIRVNDLCADAKINKSTFYRHYTDIFALSDKLEDETVDDIMRDFSSVDCLFTNPEEFIRSMLEAAEQHNERIQLLFRDRISVLTDKMELRLKGRYLSAAHTQEDDITMSFLVGGAAHVFMNPKYDIDKVATTLAALLEHIPAGRFYRFSPASPA